ncbi:ras GEF [Marasmius fiardii PR-910]|nr:ras GEF [Marasmius fiardii PR-910]
MSLCDCAAYPVSLTSTSSSSSFRSPSLPQPQMRQSLHLSIDPSPFSSVLHHSPDSGSPSSSSRPSTDTSPTSSYSDVICSVLCMYDFQSEDPVHLPFRRNDILDIVRTEPTGWWAAMKKGGDSETVGWIPGAFVEPLSEEMADRLMNVRAELRIYEYEAEQLYNTAPTSRIPLYEDPSPRKDRRQGGYETDPQSRASGWVPPRRTSVSPSPATPLPAIPREYCPVGLPRRNTSLCVNKPTPPTPKEQEISITPASSTTVDPDLFRKRPPRLLPLQETQLSSDTSKSPDSASKRSDEKIKKLTGSDAAVIQYNTVLMAANMPPYLKPRYSNELDTDNDGKVVRGSKRALVEKLVWELPAKDPIRAAEDTAYRRVFLTTFRTFMSANDLFEMLVDYFRTEPPPGLTEAEFEEWREKNLHPTQRMVLTIFSMWLEESRLLEEEPQIATPLTAFLNYIKAPHPLASQGQCIVESIKRLTFTIPPTNYPPLSSKATKSKKKKDPRGDLLRLDYADVAEQLCLLEFNHYSKITPQECIRYAKTQSGKSVEHLNTFCSTHDKIAAWVTNSVLDSTVLARRADTVDFWIKVAEKCRALNNFASMSAIINALSSTVIARLHLTWAHVNKKHTLESLAKQNEPTGNFAVYRNLQINAEGPCVPFVGMYLNDIVHIKDQYSDDKERDLDPKQWKISFTQRLRWYEVTKVMLRSQTKPYKFAENRETMEFINRATATFPKDWQAKFWAKSQVVQHSEIANADIRRGLEAAGF